jgi:hypothetical protein
MGPAAGEHSLEIEAAPCARPARRNLTRAPSLAPATIHQEADHVPEGRPAHLRERGTLAGDLLWLGIIGFILASITGMIG